jgi:peptide deformylase
MILRVTHYGEPILKKKGAPVTQFDASLRRLATDMIETMHDEEGIGLAAQQIGEALQLFVMDLRADGDPAYEFTYDGRAVPLDLIMPLVVANPKIEPMACDMTAYEEGCLSFPGIRGVIERPERLTLHFQDGEGANHVIVCDGLFARCIQHEYDHLQGILFTERMDTRTLRGLDARLKKLRRQSRDFLKTGQT